MRYFVWGLVVLLIILHQDFWLWEDTHLVFGFMPVTLMYHVSISIAAAVVWFLAINFCWPDELEERVIEATSEEPQE